MQKWLEQAKREQDFQRVLLLQRLQKQLSPDLFDGSSADLRAVGDVWLGLFRPLQQKILAERKGRQQLWQLDDRRGICCRSLFRVPRCRKRLRRCRKLSRYLIGFWRQLLG